MGLRIVTLVVSVAGWLGVPGIVHATDVPAHEAGSSSGESSAVVQTLPNAASYGPSRRGAWRIDANVPQTSLVWERGPVVDEPPPPRTSPYLRYAAHPYAEGGRGFVLRGSVGADESPPGRLHTGQFAVEGGQSGPAQGRASLALRFGFWRVGFDSNVASHFGRSGPVRTRLAAGSTNGLFAPVLRPKLMWWVGAGVNYATPSSTRSGVGVGPNLTSTLDAFVRRPLVMSVRGDVGTVDGVRTMAGRGTLGFMLKSFELYGGYEARRLGELLLMGPMLGARAWF